MNRSKLFNAPIPGENLTVDSRNYAWHKPPQYPNFDDAFEYFAEEILGNAKRMNAAVLMSRNGFSAVALVQNLMLHAVGNGKITPDMSLLIAGPVYKTLVRMLDAFGEDYLTGYDSVEEIRAYMDRMGKEPKKKKKAKLTKSQEAEMERITEEAVAEIPEGGLMGAPSKESIEIPMDSSKNGLVEKPTEETV